MLTGLRRSELRGLSLPGGRVGTGGPGQPEHPSRGALYETFPAAEARRITKRLQFHYTPKHGSWLNLAEIEFSILPRSCLRQRLPDETALRREVQALVAERNAARPTINWQLNTQDA